MTLITLICSIISAFAAVFNMVTALKNSVCDVSIIHTYTKDEQRAFLRITIENNSDNSIKVTNLVVETDNGIVQTSEGTVYFTPFDQPYVLLSHDTVRYGYKLPVSEKPKKITISFSKRVSFMRRQKTIVLD